MGGLKRDVVIIVDSVMVVVVVVVLVIGGKWKTQTHHHIYVCYEYFLLFFLLCVYLKTKVVLLHRNPRSITSKLIQHAMTTTTANRKMQEHKQKDKSQFQTELNSPFLKCNLWHDKLTSNVWHCSERKLKWCEC